MKIVLPLGGRDASLDLHSRKVLHAAPGLVVVVRHAG